MSTINFTTAGILTIRINEELALRGLSSCMVKHINNNEVAIQFDIKPGRASMNNVIWIEAQNRRMDQRVSMFDEIDDVLYGALDGVRLQPISKVFTINHDQGTYTVPLEPRTPCELKTPEKTELQKQFEVECEAAFPGHFDFKLFINGSYNDELTRYTFAGYELAHKNMNK